MKARRSIEPVLTDILDAIDGIEKATSGKTFEEFKSDWLLRLATQRALEIISEAARHIPDDLLDAAPNVPWKQIRGIGNILRHEYHKIADDVVWAVVAMHIEPLKNGILVIQGNLTAG
ncbi:HepT-like ribonuclease domain-containing protein [Pararhizobium sp.]|uniref:HepT-like ribonuclease domain-containing protein n=1 Tax=Pararhizobium sp. TaxID=1977563 RepID=UPI00271AA843|nr:HepT-like ribonuclease domain-containing protein [Pararhizobium sp.]MDO9417283.1 DUF86 domain-containing protein [Pararhizobium sp.]